MNNPPPAPQLLLPFGLSNAPDDSDSDSTGTWDEDGTSASDDSDEEACSLPDEGCADEGYWEDETAADAWLARFPGGTSALYPQLFLVKPRGGKVVTPTRHPDRTNSLLHLPSEIRNRIYIHYFDGDEEVRHPKESYAAFQNHEGIAMQRILLGSENVELKFWLSTALLQTSRQLRHEAMFILFSNRAITVEWLPALPRLVEFLGKEGCAMVRYLDIWDTLNVQGEELPATERSSPVSCTSLVCCTFVSLSPGAIALSHGSMQLNGTQTVLPRKTRFPRCGLRTLTCIGQSATFSRN
jgi:hypothetical protein